jgi:hypothetical protein
MDPHDFTRTGERRLRHACIMHGDGTIVAGAPYFPSILSLNFRMWFSPAGTHPENKLATLQYIVARIPFGLIRLFPECVVASSAFVASQECN